MAGAFAPQQEAGTAKAAVLSPVPEGRSRNVRLHVSAHVCHRIAEVRPPTEPNAGQSFAGEIRAAGWPGAGPGDKTLVLKTQTP